MLKLSPRSCILKPHRKALSSQTSLAGRPELGIAVDVHQGSSRPRRIGDLTKRAEDIDSPLSGIAWH